jgi:chemotaxis regulatin CheY-phosphate phosphatase CheZ
MHPNSAFAWDDTSHPALAAKAREAQLEKLDTLMYVQKKLIESQRALLDALSSLVDTKVELSAARKKAASETQGFLTDLQLATLEAFALIQQGSV